MDQKEGMGVYTWLGRQVYRGEFRQDFREGYGELISIVEGHEKLEFRGCWGKGVKKEHSRIDKDAAKRLYIFLDEQERYE